MPPRRRIPKHDKRKYKTNWGNVWSKANQALSIAKQLQTLVNVERKYVVTTTTSNPLLASPAIIFLSGCAQGVTQTERNGNKVKSHDIFVKFYLTHNSGGGANQFVRILLVNDRQSNGASPVTGALLQSSTNYLAPLNTETCPSRFKILMDRTISLNANTKSLFNFQVYKKLNYHTTYSGNTSGQIDALSGHMYLFMYTNENVAAPQVISMAKWGFIDN